MSDSSDSSDDEEYIPPVESADESVDDTDEASDEDVSGLSEKVQSDIRKVEELDREAIWNDFLNEKSVSLDAVKAESYEDVKTPSCKIPKLSAPPSVSDQIQSSSLLKRPLASNGDRLSDALKRLKSVALPSNSISKLTTLEKSRLDWENFTKQEDIADELKLHNKGKHGYIERKAFESRASEREYLIRKEAILKGCKKA